MNSMESYIGRKVNLVTVIKEFELDGEKCISTQYRVDENDAIVKELRSLYNSIRFRTPGWRGTTESKLTRMNVTIDANGIITRMHFG